MHFTVNIRNHEQGIYRVYGKPFPRVAVEIEGDDWKEINKQVEKLRKIIVEEPKEE